MDYYQEQVRLSKLLWRDFKQIISNEATEKTIHITEQKRNGSSKYWSCDRGDNVSKRSTLSF